MMYDSAYLLQFTKLRWTELIDVSLRHSCFATKEVTSPLDTPPMSRLLYTIAHRVNLTQSTVTSKGSYEDTLKIDEGILSFSTNKRSRLTFHAGLCVIYDIMVVPAGCHFDTEKR